MDQPKMERMLRLMQYLSDNTTQTIDQMARDLGMSKRTIFRYIDTFKASGFAITRVGEGVYKMTTHPEIAPGLEDLVYFTEEESIVLARLIENLSNTNSMKASLKKKLAAVVDSTSLADYMSSRSYSSIIGLLEQAIKEHKQVKLTHYSSSNSNKAKNYVIEPFAFTLEYADVWAYDIKAKANKMFKLTRMEDVTLLEDWKHEDKHEARTIDAFRMSGDGHPLEHVKLKMTTRAKNLLVEEFPVTSKEVSKEKRSWYWEGDVNAYEGVGRFVMGLHREITLEEGEGLRAWILDEATRTVEMYK